MERKGTAFDAILLAILWADLALYQFGDGRTIFAALSGVFAVVNVAKFGVRLAE